MIDDRPRKVHLYRDQAGRKHRGLRSTVDNTLCASNHGDRGLLKTSVPAEVTCKRCLNLMADSPVGQLEVMLTETSKHLSEAEDLLDLYRARAKALQRTLRFALAQLGEERYVVIHTPTEFCVGDLIEAVLAAEVTDEHAS